MEKKQVMKPCVRCIYFDSCGNTNRTMPCDGRVTKSEKKADKKREVQK